MPEIPSLHPVLQGWLLDGPLAAYVPAYLERLERGRYASSTSRRCLNAVAHFAHWMSLCRNRPLQQVRQVAPGAAAPQCRNRPVRLLLAPAEN